MSIRSFISAAGALAIVAGAPMALQAQNTQADFRADNAFVSQVAASNLLEVRLGQTAQSKAQTPRVQQFGTRMVDDHTRSQQQWMALGSQYRVPVNARLSSEQEQQLERLRNLSGRDFEVAYMDQMVLNHQTSLNNLTTQGRAARSAGTRELVERSIPIVQEHLTLASQIRSELGGAGVAAIPGNQQPGDNGLVSQVAATNLLEVRLGQIATTKAQTPRVKQFADQMVTDHTTMQREWMETARRLNIPFNARFSTFQEQELNRLNGLSGREFELAYMNLMVQDHQTLLSTFQTQRRAAQSADLRSLVERGTPILQQHFNQAVQINSEIGGAAVAVNPVDTQAAAGAPVTLPNVKRDPGTPKPDANQQNQANAANAGGRGTGDIKKDKKFVVDMQNHHFLEKSLGELAARKGQNQQVREYGRKTANDHANMDEQWIQMANNNGLSLKPTMGPEHRERLTKLEKKSGRSFDKEYMTMEVQQHKGYLNALMKEGRGANSSAVRELSERFTVTEVNHFNLAKQIGAQVGADTSAKLRTTTSVR